MTSAREWDPAMHGVVAHLNAGGFGRCHRIGCSAAPCAARSGFGAPSRRPGGMWRRTGIPVRAAGGGPGAPSGAPRAGPRSAPFATFCCDCGDGGGEVSPWT
jgi:hypothetical protein